jgi:hypothetical protein
MGDKTSTETMTEYFIFLSACIGLSLISLWWLDHQRPELSVRAV